jgi:hypothetical protein
MIGKVYQEDASMIKDKIITKVKLGECRCKKVMMQGVYYNVKKLVIGF